MKLRSAILVVFLNTLAFPASIDTQSFNTLTWAGSSRTGFTEYSITASGPLGLNFINAVNSSGTWLVQNLPVYEPGTLSTVIGGFTGGPYRLSRLRRLWYPRLPLALPLHTRRVRPLTWNTMRMGLQI